MDVNKSRELVPVQVNIWFEEFGTHKCRVGLQLVLCLCLLETHGNDSRLGPSFHSAGPANIALSFLSSLSVTPRRFRRRAQRHPNRSLARAYVAP